VKSVIRDLHQHAQGWSVESVKSVIRSYHSYALSFCWIRSNSIQRVWEEQCKTTDLTDHTDRNVPGKASRYPDEALSKARMRPRVNHCPDSTLRHA